MQAGSSVLFVYFTYTQQTLKVVQAMGMCCGIAAAR